MKPFVYVRALKHVEHTVFCVEDGQKTYYDPQFQRSVPYSSGQQVKRSILQSVADIMNLPVAPITFNYEITKDKKLSNKEPWSPCDPTYVDQLLGGWMRAKNASGENKKEEGKDKDNNVIKRRSPLSVSALHPLHPLLVSVEKESLTFDRSDRPDYHPVNVRVAGSDRLLSEEQIEEFLSEHGRTLPRRNWIPENKRATGLFVYDIAVDLRTLFCVSMNQHEPEISKEKIEELKEKGWIEGMNVFGKCLILPEEMRKKIIPALAESLIDWRITSNQARTFSLMETLAVAVSDNANTLAAAIRAKLTEDGDSPKVRPILDAKAGADLFVTLPCAGYIVTECEHTDALEEAKAELVKRMSKFDYEHQL